MSDQTPDRDETAEDEAYPLGHQFPDDNRELFYDTVAYMLVLLYKEFPLPLAVSYNLYLGEAGRDERISRVCVATAAWLEAEGFIRRVEDPDRDDDLIPVHVLTLKGLQALESTPKELFPHASEPDRTAADVLKDELKDSARTGKTEVIRETVKWLLGAARGYLGLEVSTAWVFA